MSRDWCQCDHPQPQPAEGESYWICGECGNFTQDPTAEAHIAQLLDRIERAAERQPNVGDPRHVVSDEHGWITAAEVARGLGVSRDYVYEHAAELGARRLPSNGPRPRLRFPASILAPPESNGSEGDRRDQGTRP